MSDLYQLVPADILALSAYHTTPTGDAEIILHANESPWSLDDADRAALARELSQVDTNRYPDPSLDDLRAAIAAYIGVQPHTLILGNGSDELITLLATCFRQPRATGASAAMLYPTPSFGFYRLAAIAAGMRPVEVPLDVRFELVPEVLFRHLTKHQPNLAFFARPNNPTGTLWNRDLILDVAARFPSTVVVCDEAYYDYAGDSLLSEVSRVANLVVLRTLSKIGLAAVRIGALHAQPPVLSVLEKLRAPYNIGTLNQCAATWVLKNRADMLAKQAEGTIRERTRVSAALVELGYAVFDSRANFVLFRTTEVSATELCASLRQRSIVVRDLDSEGPLSGCIRVTIGTPAENDALLAAVRAHS